METHVEEEKLSFFFVVVGVGGVYLFMYVFIYKNIYGRFSSIIDQL
jgi:hypothetical protein